MIFLFIYQGNAHTFKFEEVHIQRGHDTVVDIQWSCKKALGRPLKKRNALCPCIKHWFYSVTNTYHVTWTAFLALYVSAAPYSPPY